MITIQELEEKKKEINRNRKKTLSHNFGVRLGELEDEFKAEYLDRRGLGITDAFRHVVYQGMLKDGVIIEK